MYSFMRSPLPHALLSHFLLLCFFASLLYVLISRKYIHTRARSRAHNVSLFLFVSFLFIRFDSGSHLFVSQNWNKGVSMAEREKCATFIMECMLSQCIIFWRKTCKSTQTRALARSCIIYLLWYVECVIRQNKWKTTKTPRIILQRLISSTCKIIFESFESRKASPIWFSVPEWVRSRNEQRLYY